MSVTDSTQSVLDFFEQLFEHDEGFVCISTMRAPVRRDTFKDHFFEWPADKQSMIDFIDKVRGTHNVYFGVNVLSVPRRKKENCIPQNLVWADLDTCRPDQVDIPPQVVIESSPGRYQAIWRMDRKVDPLMAENYGKRIAYAYAEQGADKSGHDLTQLLRVPGSYNFKYQLDEPPTVRLITNMGGRLPTTVFDALPVPDDSPDLPDLDVPELASLPSPDMIIYRYTDALMQNKMMNQFARYYGQEPPSDWSGHLWRLLLVCFEVGMTAEEAFVIAKNSKSNKYQRDGRPDSHLWREVLKAELERKSVEILLQDHRYLVMPPLLSMEEEEALGTTLIDDYMAWATEATDAVPEFHEINCAMLMSCLMATTLRLETRFGKIVPNLWAMLLGDSTLTRKTTAMNMAMDFIIDINKELIVSSDGSVEGLVSRLALRPRMVSIFFRDEVSGFFDQMQRKEYLAGMPETMTKMYDVPKYLPKTLRKETFILQEPIFIFFGGGVPDKMYSLIHEEYFTSGFVPRFLVMRGYADMARIRPIGPPVEASMAKRDGLASTFAAYHSIYTDAQVAVKTHDGQQMLDTPEIYVSFTEDMWARAAIMEKQLTDAANGSPESEKANPMFSRMYISLLKLTMLFAAARQEPQQRTVRGEMRDLLQAAHYIQKWGRHSVDLIRHSGVNRDEQQLMTIYRTIEKHPGILRSDIMQRHRVNSRQMTLIEETLEQRRMLDVHVKGKARAYWPVGR